MKIHIAGSRGSLPSPSGMDLDGNRFSTEEFGGNTTCYYLESANKRIVVDAGSGIAPLGRYLMKKGLGKELDLYITHTHWDHIQGFPFFTPAYIKGNNIKVYGEAQITGDLVNTINHTDPTQLSKVLQINGIGLKGVLADQQKPRNFPAPLEFMGGLAGFYDFIPGGLIKEEGNLKVESTSISHPGGCVSYKFTENIDGKSKSIVISTDFEPDFNGTDNKLVEWWQNADLVIADGQYEIDSKQNPFMKSWGHSDAFKNLEFARRANVKHLVITHHDPKSDDKYLRDLETRVKLSAHGGLEVDFAREGMCFEV